MELNEDIKKTIEYAKKFDCELTNEEIVERLISNKVYKDEEIEKMIKTHRLYETPPLKREAFSKEKIEKAERFVKLIKDKFKDILYIGVTGSVAAGHPNKDDDIDLIIITKKDKLWWTRLKMRYFIYKNSIPHRKYGKQENKNELCFNFWLDQNHLRLPKNRHNLRCSVDLILMKPIMNRENIYEKFMLENKWAKKWVASGYSKKTKLFEQNPSALQAPPLDRGAFIFFVINILLFVPQYLFMRKKIKSEEVNLGYALFNERHKSIDRKII